MVYLDRGPSRLFWMGFRVGAMMTGRVRDLATGRKREEDHVIALVCGEMSFAMRCFMLMVCRGL